MTPAINLFPRLFLVVFSCSAVLEDPAPPLLAFSGISCQEDRQLGDRRVH